MNSFQTWLLNDPSHNINIYDYFDREKVWIFEEGDNMEDVTLTVHNGDLTINTVADLPKNTQVLMVKGNLTINDTLTLVGYYPEPFTLGGLIVCGDLKCKNMHLSWGDIVVMGNAYIEEYIFSSPPEFEQGSVHIRGEISIPYIFRGNESNPNYYFDKNSKLGHYLNINFKTNETTSNPRIHIIENIRINESNSEIEFIATTVEGKRVKFTLDSFYLYCKENKFTTNQGYPVWKEEASLMP